MPLISKTNLGKLYRPLEKLGENVTLDLELSDFNGQLLETFSSSHEENDGLSLLYKAINQKFSQNWKVPLGNLGSQKKSLVESIYLFIKALSRKQPQDLDLKIPTNLRPSLNSAKRKIKIEASLVKQIENFCDQKNFSVNSFLASAVFKSFSVIFNINTSRWMIPVNIRKNAEQQQTEGMYSSYFLIRYEIKNSVKDVHSQMRSHLQSGIHWANYYLGLILTSLPDSLIFWLTKRDFNKHTSDIVGSFSNLGSWKDIDSKYKGYSWAMFPTVRMHRPFGITVIQWGDELTFAMRLHDSIDQSELKLNQFCEELKKNLKEMSAE